MFWERNPAFDWWTYTPDPGPIFSWSFAIYSSFQIIFINRVFRGSMSTAPSSSSLLHRTNHSIASVHPLWNLQQRNSPPPAIPSMLNVSEVLKHPFVSSTYHHIIEFYTYLHALNWWILPGLYYKMGSPGSLLLSNLSCLMAAEWSPFPFPLSLKDLMECLHFQVSSSPADIWVSLHKKTTDFHG